MNPKLLAQYSLGPERFSLETGWLLRESMPPTILSNAIRLKLYVIEEEAESEEANSDESKTWCKSRRDGASIACRWMFEGFTKVLRRRMEVRAMSGAKGVEPFVPEVDIARFRATFGFPSQTSFQDDCEYLTRNLLQVWERMGKFVGEFKVMFADFNDAAEQGLVAHDGWVEAIEHPITQVKRMPFRVWAPGQIRLDVLGGIPHVAPVAPVMDRAPASPEARVAHAQLQDQLRQQEVKLAELTAELDLLRADLRHEREEGVAAQFRDLVKSLRGRIHYLETREGADLAIPLAQDSLPTNWDALPEFAATRLGGRVVISRRAYRAVKGSVFRNVPFAYDVLRMLADDYVPMRRGAEGARERFEVACKRLRVTVSNTGEAADAHRTTEAYRVNHLGQRLALDMHVRGNSSRDPRDGFRLYFHYYGEADEGVVVVGHLPSHLDSSLS